jgi:hypothetical protein
MLRNLLAFVLFLVGLTAISQSQSVILQNEKGEPVELYKKSYALLIGAGNYYNGWPKLNGVMQDVAAVKEALEEQGFTVVTVIDPTLEELQAAYRDFINKYGLDKDNRLILYFAGHGHTIRASYGEEMGYIVPVDAPNPNIDKKGFLSRAMAMEQIEVFAKQIQSKHALFLFDACFSGSIFAISRAIPENITYKTTKPVRQFITSGSADETVPDESVFRQQFIAALEGEADVNNDGFITGTELGEFLQEKVVNYSHGSQHPQYGKIRNPHLDKGDFVFVALNDENGTLTASKADLPATETKRASETAGKVMPVLSFQPVIDEPLFKSVKNMPGIFGKFALMTDDGHFLCAERGGGSSLSANREAISIWETFRLVNLGDNKIAFETYNKHFLTLGEKSKDLDAKADTINRHAVFELYELENNKIALKAANGLFVCAERGGEHEVRARSEYVNPYEVFRLIRVNTFGMKSPNGHYATLINDKIIFNKKELENNEKFEFVKIDKDKVAIKAPNGKYVTIDEKGAYAKASQPDASSVFIVDEVDSKSIRLKTLQGKYVTVIGGGGFSMRARKESAGPWELIRLFPATPKIQN